MRKLFLLIAAAILLPGAVFAYVNPGQPVGYVNDFAQLLSAEQVHALDVKIDALEKTSGNEITVVTIQSLEGDTIENFAVHLFEDWKVGKKDQDNGIVVLIAKEDRKIRIEVGYGLEPYVTDLEASHLIQNVLIPAFKQGQYYEGIDQTVSLLIQKLNGDNSSAFLPHAQDTQPDYSSYFLFGVFGLLFLTRVFAQSRSWWLGGAIGAAAGVVVSILFGFISIGLIAFLVLIPLGLFIDFIFSRIGPGGGPGGLPGLGRWGGGSSGGGFGGFGGGRSGGGGASGSW